MEWHNEKLLPVGLPELAYQVTPREIADRLQVVAVSRWKGGGKRGWKGCVTEVHRTYIVLINANTVYVCAPRHAYGVPATAVWMEFLRTYLHEIGHIVAWLTGRDPCDRVRYEHDTHYQMWVEDLADAWAEEVIARIAARHPYLGQPQPGVLGNYPGMRLVEEVRKTFGWRDKGYAVSGRGYVDALVTARAAKVEGQLTTKAVARATGVSPARVRRLARQFGVGRVYTDRAGRQHVYYAWWEVRQIMAAWQAPAA